ncbi:MAG: hypothetical protein OXT69_14790 [Candidatus Poribacteria bacterium]|nr:hypothetical protein [Candidatus Poribacteria bacterium]
MRARTALGGVALCGFLMTMGAQAQEKIVGPWLWVVYPTAANQGGQASTDVDSFDAATNGDVTELDVAQNGAMQDEDVGGVRWTIGELVNGQVNAMLTQIGLLNGDVNDHTAYGFIAIESPRAQNDVTMRVGSDDSIKVWLNGDEKHRNAVNRGGGENYLDNFKVDLKAGENLLLVKCSERSGGWTLSVGIEAEYTANLDNYADEVDVTPPPKLEGPYLWMIAPTAAGQGGANSTDVDSLDEASGGRVTEKEIAMWGPLEGSLVGDYRWTEGKIAPTGGGNLNNMLTEIGLTNGDVDDHTAYGYINVVSPVAQKARGYIGTDDSSKVWVNGKQVERHAGNQGVGDYARNFPIELRRGSNPVLVKCSERTGGWTLFFGIAATQRLEYNTKQYLSVDPAGKQATAWGELKRR